MATELSVDAVMAELRTRVREQLRADLLRQGGPAAFQEPALFHEVERILHQGVSAGEKDALILPELLGDPQTWRLETAMRYRTHRTGFAGSAIMFIKGRLMMPFLRWLFEYNRDNFERQRRVNQVLFACVQELAIETARLRQEVRRLSP